MRRAACGFVWIALALGCQAEQVDSPLVLSLPQAAGCLTCPAIDADGNPERSGELAITTYVLDVFRVADDALPALEAAADDLTPCSGCANSDLCERVERSCVCGPAGSTGAEIEEGFSGFTTGNLEAGLYCVRVVMLEGDPAEDGPRACPEQCPAIDEPIPDPSICVLSTPTQTGDAFVSLSQRYCRFNRTWEDGTAPNAEELCGAYAPQGPRSNRYPPALCEFLCRARVNDPVTARPPLDLDRCASF
ncbi:MAG: hypothetical protein AB8I08_15310 [Sandaracinaceae bacterium]